jgi:hypothetical protein
MGKVFSALRSFGLKYWEDETCEHAFADKNAAFTAPQSRWINRFRRVIASLMFSIPVA